MTDIQDKTYDLLESLNQAQLTDQFFESFKAFIKMQNLYQSAIREITTKLENLNDEFKYLKNRNPIHQIQSRVKTPKSILGKMERKGLPYDLEKAVEALDDIAGVRVTCSYTSDIYKIADLLTSQDDIELISKSDYILNPKESGYRSLHLVVGIPVFLSEEKVMVKVEIQIRTIAMDFWASLEHELAYKMPKEEVAMIRGELRACADVIADTDLRMQTLHEKIASR